MMTNRRGMYDMVNKTELKSVLKDFEDECIILQVKGDMGRPEYSVESQEKLQKFINICEKYGGYENVARRDNCENELNSSAQDPGYPRSHEERLHHEKTNGDRSSPTNSSQSMVNVSINRKKPTECSTENNTTSRKCARVVTENDNEDLEE